ncbi:PREDICTED: polymerase I and transcript release factor [Gekko japonicus]|uniref:Polymerase I and transcript release factor n=1 Tax=Gekko japonicus TaxID=146911 RepID=A0ABM1K2L0_GEKJA|nr:PREDICTED: polymerase I and transcript release factor [Gekko japonicus]
MAETALQIVEQPAASEASEEPASEEPIKSDQINGVMVLTLLDKIIGAVDQIQLTQSQLEERQQEMDGVVASIQGELAKLTKAHSTTSNTVNKMLEKVRKVSVNVKTVRQNLEKQGGQIKKLESNEAELLKRRNFKVMIYQPEMIHGAPCEPSPESVPADFSPESAPLDLSEDSDPYDPSEETLLCGPSPESVPWPRPAQEEKGGSRFGPSRDDANPLLLKL